MPEPYYNIEKHSYMRYENDRLAHLIHDWIDHPSMQRFSTAIELGAGMGRFSAPLFEKYKSVILEEPVESYAQFLRDRFQSSASITTLTAEAYLAEYKGPPVALYCFHLMHHLTRSIRDSIYSFVVQSGSLGVLVEPNPINPLLLIQILVTPDMSFEEEKQYLSLGKSAYEAELSAHGLTITEYKRFLVCPPFLSNALLQHSGESIIKGLEYLRWMLPFLCSYQLIVFEKLHAR